MGDTELVDSMIHDGLWCAFDDRHMGDGHRRDQRRARITREDQDAWAARSHVRAAEPGSGRLAERGRAGRGPAAQGRPGRGRARRGHPRRAPRPRRSRRCGPRSPPDGTITAGNASQISDGGAAVVVMSEAKAAELGLHADRRDRRATAWSPDRYPSLHTAPALAHGEGAEEGRLAGRDLGLSRSTRPSPPSPLHTARMLGHRPRIS